MDGCGCLLLLNHWLLHASVQLSLWLSVLIFFSFVILSPSSSSTFPLSPRQYHLRRAFGRHHRFFLFIWFIRILLRASYIFMLIVLRFCICIKNDYDCVNEDECSCLVAMLLRSERASISSYRTVLVGLQMMSLCFNIDSSRPNTRTQNIRLATFTECCWWFVARRSFDCIYTYIYAVVLQSLQVLQLTCCSHRFS